LTTLFPVKGNGQNQETAARYEAEAIRILTTLLPANWRVSITQAGGRRVDRRASIHAPDGTSLNLLLGVKAGQLPSSDAVVGQLSTRARSAGLAPLLVVSYAGPGLRRACEAYDVNYLDLTGWVSICSSSPALVLRGTGAARDPRPPRAAVISRLNGQGAGRVVRDLLAGSQPIGVRELATRAKVSPGTVSKVLKTLAVEGVIEREQGGQVRAVAKRALVERWTRDYQFLRTNLTGWYLAPRGLAQLVEQTVASGRSATATGSLALRGHISSERVPVTGLSQLSLYVPDLAEFSGRFGLVTVDRPSANVILAEPYDPSLLTGGRNRTQLPVVDIGQNVADLLTLPGRGPEEADQLMSYLAETDPAWR
jgi:DNA-binding HxlR family transcriptional regulator